MKELTETTVLQEGLVKITDHRTLIGTLTYSMNDINSVTVIRRRRSTRPIWLVLVGSLLILWSIVDQTGYYIEFFNWGIVLVIIGLAIAFLEKPAYVLQIRSASEVRDILGSTDRSFIQRIASAMNQVIVSRGGQQEPKGSQPRFITG
jgi:hypothetical protein